MQGMPSRPAGTSEAAAIVGGIVGGLSAIALEMVVGPFAGPLGMGIGYLTTEAWDTFRKVLEKYKAAYKEKKKQNINPPGECLGQ
jgi:hypothetical protein